jgi:hypothetical protein
MVTVTADTVNLVAMAKVVAMVMVVITDIIKITFFATFPSVMKIIFFKINSRSYNNILFTKSV